MTRDIVNRLRTNRDCLAPCLMDEAADEIVRLERVTLDLIAERDEARRLAIAHQVDLQRASAGKLYESEWEAKFRIAKERGWDCFEQDN